jgi:hypothetical protein
MGGTSLSEKAAYFFANDVISRQQNRLLPVVFLVGFGSNLA